MLLPEDDGKETQIRFKETCLFQMDILRDGCIKDEGDETQAIICRFVWTDVLVIITTLNRVGFTY